MTYKSNADKVLGDLKKKLMEGDKLAGSVAQAIYASNLRRIHNEGRNIKGSSIGTYSRSPTYINPANSPRKFAPIGKHGQSRFKNGKPHKTRYFGDGYKGFRGHIGRETGIVNLQLTGSLKANFQMIKTNSGYALGFMSYKKGEIAQGLEGKYNSQIWGVTNKDKAIVKTIINNWARA